MRACVQGAACVFDGWPSGDESGMYTYTYNHTTQNLYALASQRISDQILREGKNLGSGILKVNSFVNHRVRGSVDWASTLVD